MSGQNESPYYFVPHPSRHPVMAATGLLVMLASLAMWVNGHTWGPAGTFVGLLFVLFVLWHWFGDAISESEGGMYGKRVRSRTIRTSRNNHRIFVNRDIRENRAIQRVSRISFFSRISRSFRLPVRRSSDRILLQVEHRSGDAFALVAGEIGSRERDISRQLQPAKR